MSESKKESRFRIKYLVGAAVVVGVGIYIVRKIMKSVHASATSDMRTVTTRDGRVVHVPHLYKLENVHIWIQRDTQPGSWERAAAFATVENNQFAIGAMFDRGLDFPLDYVMTIQQFNDMSIKMNADPLLRKLSIDEVRQYSDKYGLHVSSE